MSDTMTPTPADILSSSSNFSSVSTSMPSPSTSTHLDSTIDPSILAVNLPLSNLPRAEDNHFRAPPEEDINGFATQPPPNPASALSPGDIAPSSPSALALATSVPSPDLEIDWDRFATYAFDSNAAFSSTPSQLAPASYEAHAAGPSDQQLFNTAMLDTFGQYFLYPDASPLFGGSDDHPTPGPSEPTAAALCFANALPTTPAPTALYPLFPSSDFTFFMPPPGINDAQIVFGAAAAAATSSSPLPSLSALPSPAIASSSQIPPQYPASQPHTYQYSGHFMPEDVATQRCAGLKDSPCKRKEGDQKEKRHTKPCVKCPEAGCGRCFARRDSLKRHMIDTRGTCPACGSSFSREKDSKFLERHKDGVKGCLARAAAEEARAAAAAPPPKKRRRT